MPFHIFKLAPGAGQQTAICFEGAGARGIGYAGFWDEWVKAGMAENIEHVVGSSAGAIMSMLVALGYTPDEIKAEVLSMDFTRFQDHGEHHWWKSDFIAGISSLVGRTHGFYDGAAFLEWAQEKVAAKLGNPDATFADLQRAREAGDATKKKLIVTGTRINDSKEMLFSDETFPDMPIAVAVRASMAITGAFGCVRHDVTTGEWITDDREIPEDHSVDYIVDGGTKMNDAGKAVLDRLVPVPQGYRRGVNGVNPGAVNVRIDTADEMKSVLWNQHVKYTGSDFVTSLLPSDEDAGRGPYTVQIFDCGVSTLEFDLSAEKKHEMITVGTQAAHDWLQNYADAILLDKHFDTLEDLINAGETEGHDQEDALITSVDKYIAVRLRFEQIEKHGGPQNPEEEADYAAADRYLAGNETEEYRQAYNDYIERLQSKHIELDGQLSQHEEHLDVHFAKHDLENGSHFVEHCEKTLLAAEGGEARHVVSHEDMLSSMGHALMHDYRSKAHDRISSVLGREQRQHSARGKLDAEERRRLAELHSEATHRSLGM